MSGGKQTPRQKMIGMMYLVLTALLALNVSKDILNAFILINHGLESTVENFKKKNESIYNQFDKQLGLNPLKVKPFYDKALLAKQHSMGIVKEIETLKKRLIGETGGVDEKDSTPKGKDDVTITSHLMIDLGAAHDIKNKIISFKKKMLDCIPPKEQAYLKIGLDTKDPKPKEGEHLTWEDEHFEHIPMIACVTFLSELQTEVKNYEADVISLLYRSIDASDFKFDRLEARVIAPKSYIILGQEYTADVFVAAFNTTQNPKIQVGQVDTTKNVFVGKADSIPVSIGVGTYKTRASAEGVQKWGGIITMTAPDGSIKPFVFHSEYIVAKPSMSISLDKMNVFYIGVPNPVTIAVSGMSPDKVRAGISQGTISGSKGKYEVNVNSPGDALISVTAEVDGKQQSQGPPIKYRVKKIPDPVAKIGGKTGGLIEKNVLAAQAGIQSALENFDFDARFSVIGYTMTYSGSGTDLIDLKANGAALSPDMISAIKGLRPKKRVFFENIKAKGPDGTIRDLLPINLTIK